MNTCIFIILLLSIFLENGEQGNVDNHDLVDKASLILRVVNENTPVVYNVAKNTKIRNGGNNNYELNRKRWGAKARKLSAMGEPGFEGNTNESNKIENDTKKLRSWGKRKKTRNYDLEKPIANLNRSSQLRQSNHSNRFESIYISQNQEYPRSFVKVKDEYLRQLNNLNAYDTDGLAESEPSKTIDPIVNTSGKNGKSKKKRNKKWRGMFYQREVVGGLMGNKIIDARKVCVAVPKDELCASKDDDDIPISISAPKIQQRVCLLRPPNEYCVGEEGYIVN